MGAEPYYYFVQYQMDTQAALQELRACEFAAGRYRPVMHFIEFPIGPGSRAPGPRHKSIEEVLEVNDEAGTRSILDLQFVGDEPGFGVACRMSKQRLIEIYGTAKPTRDIAEHNMGFFEDIDRGHGVYVILYKNALPDELLFAGYSFD